jgi:predicted DNA-binding transcriptional regulator AlpA
MIDSEPAVGRLLPANAICKDFGVCRRSIGRRIHDDPGFPRPVRIAGRLYWQEIEIENYKRDLIKRSIEGSALKA